MMAQDRTTVVSLAARTDVGMVRGHNEDNYVVCQPQTDGQILALDEGGVIEDNGQGVLFCVADGMGGHEYGEIASSIAVDSLVSHYYGYFDGAPVSAIEEAVHTANREVHADAQAHQERAGMGTTVTAAVIQHDTLFLANVGDSRAYLIRGRELVQLTVDHSYAEELGIPEEEAKASEVGHYITRCLGLNANVEVDTFIEPLEEGDIILLCSDGLISHVNETEILSIALAHDLPNATQVLIDQANAGGGTDNITVILCRVDSCVPSPVPITPKRRQPQGAIVVLENSEPILSQKSIRSWLPVIGGVGVGGIICFIFLLIFMLPAKDRPETDPPLVEIPEVDEDSIKNVLKPEVMATIKELDESRKRLGDVNKNFDDLKKEKLSILESDKQLREVFGAKIFADVKTHLDDASGILKSEDEQPSRKKMSVVTKNIDQADDGLTNIRKKRDNLKIANESYYKLDENFQNWKADSEIKNLYRSIEENLKKADPSEALKNISDFNRRLTILKGEKQKEHDKKQAKLKKDLEYLKSQWNRLSERQKTEKLKEMLPAKIKESDNALKGDNLERGEQLVLEIEDLLIEGLDEWVNAMKKIRSSVSEQLDRVDHELFRIKVQSFWTDNHIELEVFDQEINALKKAQNYVKAYEKSREELESFRSGLTQGLDEWLVFTVTVINGFKQTATSPEMAQIKMHFDNAKMDRENKVTVQSLSNLVLSYNAMAHVIRRTKGTTGRPE
jgi:PPM family protein phosphatase